MSDEKINKSPKIIYLTFGEILNAPLLRRQLIELLCEIKRIDPAVDITVLNVLPFHTYLNHIKDNKEVRLLLKKCGIKFRVLPTIVPCPLPNIMLMKTDKGYRLDMRWTRLASALLSFTLLPVFAYYHLVRGVKIFHCRSYPASYAATVAAKLFSGIKVIFDPRSDFPEENVTAGNWKKDDKNYFFWRDAEKRMLRESAAVACISPLQLDGFKKNNSVMRGFLVPNNVDCNNFQTSEQNRQKMREKLGFTQDDTVFCYLGDITSGGWHRVDIYLDVCKLFLKSNLPCRLLFVVPEVGATLLANALREYDIEHRVKIISPAYEDVPLCLGAADYGMMFLHRQKNVVGTKIGEYLAAGLPILINANCLGAVDLVHQYDVGYVMGVGVGDLDAEKLFDEDAIKTGESLSVWSRDVSAFAAQYFDNKAVAETYYKQYQALQ